MCGVDLCCGLCDFGLCWGGSGGAPERSESSVSTIQPTNQPERDNSIDQNVENIL